MKKQQHYMYTLTSFVAFWSVLEQVSASKNRKMSMLEVTVRNMQLENRLTPLDVNTGEHHLTYIQVNTT